MAFSGIKTEQNYIKIAVEYNYMHSLELYVKTTWAWSKIEKNSKLKF